MVSFLIAKQTSVGRQELWLINFCVSLHVTDINLQVTHFAQGETLILNMPEHCQVSTVL